MVRILLFLLGMLTADRPWQRQAARYRDGGPYKGAVLGHLDLDPDWPASGGGPPSQTRPLPAGDPIQPGGAAIRPGGAAIRPGGAAIRPGGAAIPAPVGAASRAGSSGRRPWS